MVQQRSLQEVVLLDGDDPSEQPGPPAGSRRRLWWIAAGAVAVVLALVGTQLVVDAREEAAYQRIAALPGVFPPLGDDLTVLRRMPDTDAAGLWTGVDLGGGRTAGLLVADDGSQSFGAVEQRTGEALWSVPLLGPNPERAASRHGYGGTCLGDTPRGEPATAAVCLVTDGFLRDGEDGEQERVPATTARVMVFDTDDGHVIAEWATDPTARIAVVDGLVAVGTPDAERGRVVVGHDLRSGDERWRYAAPSDHDAASSVPDEFWALFAAGSAVCIYDGATVTVLSSTGSVVREGLRLSRSGMGLAADPVTGALSLSTDDEHGEPRTTLLGPDPGSAADVVVPGELVYVEVDDSSVPGMVLTSRTSTHGWDRATGAELWEADVRPEGGALVLRGWVYLTTSTDIVALDGRTGETVWTTPLPASGPGALSTDGRQLLLLSYARTAADAGSGGMTVFDLATGQQTRQVHYPEGVFDVQPMHGLLVGWTNDNQEVVVLE